MDEDRMRSPLPDGKVDRLEVLHQVRADRLGAILDVNKPVEFQEFSDAVTKLGLYWLLVNKPPTY